MVVPVLSEISIGNNKEDMKGGSPWVDFLPSKNIASLVKITSAASAVGFSITSNDVAKLSGSSYARGIVAYIFPLGPNCKAPRKPPSG